MEKEEEAKSPVEEEVGEGEVEEVEVEAGEEVMW